MGKLMASILSPIKADIGVNLPKTRVTTVTSYAFCKSTRLDESMLKLYTLSSPQKVNVTSGVMVSTSAFLAC